MKQVIFALQFKGTAGPVEGAEGKLWAKTSASSQVLRTTLGEGGIAGSVEPAGGESITFESEVNSMADGAFVESGTIRYGSAGTVSFRTVGRGTMAPSAIEGLQRGAVVWEVVAAQGRLAGATGLITSNFSVGPMGEVIDNQFAQLLLP